MDRLGALQLCGCGITHEKIWSRTPTQTPSHWNHHRRECSLLEGRLLATATLQPSRLRPLIAVVDLVFELLVANWKARGWRLAGFTPPWIMSSDIEHWHINAVVHKDYVEETHYVSDPARNIRRRPETTIWHVERLLGRGGFGEVRLERNKQDGRARAVKRIAMMGTNLTNMDCEKELKALLEFSKPKVTLALSAPHFDART